MAKVQYGLVKGFQYGLAEMGSAVTLKLSDWDFCERFSFSSLACNCPQLLYMKTELEIAEILILFLAYLL